MEKTNNKPPAPTKITRPQAGGPLPRPRLFERLDGLRAHPVVWLAGPPGSGKTTLASSYLADRKLRNLWYQLDAADADIATFFYYLGLAVREASSRRRLALPPLTPEYLPGLVAYTRRFAETVAARLRPPAVLVLDNYEQVPAEASLHEVIRELAACLPEGLVILVLSRAGPPPAFARLRLHGDLAVLDGEELCLSREEADALAAARDSRGADPERIGRLYAETQGWIAGFSALLAEGLDPDSPAPGGRTREILFDYFATELFERFPPPTRRALPRTALLPAMTVPQAVELSGEPRMAEVLAELHRHNCFIVRRGQAEPVYEYHALFRSFLLHRAEAAIPPEEWRSLQRRAAGLLAASKQAEAAASLYRAAGDWPGLAALALDEAAGLIAAGRQRTLEHWLAALPGTAFEQSPWLSHWYGLARLPFAPAEARGLFEHAYARFREEDDVLGLYSTWAGIMDSFFYEWRDLRPADRWIAEFETLRRRHPEFPSRAVELRTYWAMGTLLHRQPQHPFVPVWCERGLALLDPADRDLSVLLGGYLIIGLLWWGDSARALGLIERVEPWTRTADISPMVSILWSCAKALYHSVHGQQEACLSAVEAGLALARQTGLYCWDFLLSAQAARCSLVSGELAAADTWMAAMARTMRGQSPINGAFHEHLHTHAAGQRGDWRRAERHARSGLGLALESGVPFLEAHCRLDLARALLALGDDGEWAEHLAAARAIGQAMGSRVLEYLGLETEAEAAFRRGQNETGLACLARALALSRAMDGAPWLLAGPVALARLYDQALHAGIEVDHVQRMILRRRLAPPDPATAAEAWPWPVRVHTLGRFEILRDGEPLRSSGKSQHKPLDLLKCLCAFGGHAVNQDRLTDALWPDAQGDNAEQALRTTLHRLRKLLRHEQAVRLEDRHLSLDPRHIRVDCLVFDRAAHHPELADRTSLQRNLNRYRGHFLEGESAAWAVAFRERLRARFMASAERLGLSLEQAGDWSGAAECYHGAIEIEPSAESFYRRLMGCYGQLGRRAEALAVYQRCRLALLSHLGISPSRETQDLCRALSLPEADLTIGNPSVTSPRIR